MKSLLSTSLIVCIAGLMLPLQAGAVKPIPEKIVLREIRDVDFGNTLFYFFQRQYFSAIIHLTVAQQRKTIPHHTDDAELLLGGMYLSFGMHREAGRIFNRLITEKVPLRIRNRAWFYLAKIRYQRTLYPEAEQAIGKIEGALPGLQENERRLLYAKILMAQKRYAEADSYLSETNDKSIWSVYIRYNLAVSMIKQNNIERGRELLQSIGRLKAPGKELQAIRDQANLALGYSYILEKKPAQAIEDLRKVRLKGHLSNKALLGLGWAYDQQKEYRKALLPWLELNKRNPLDSAVQESFLATAYALGRLNQDSRALDHYLTAIEIYEGEVRRLEDTIINISNGSFIQQIMAIQSQNEMGWFWEMENVPVTPESHYLINLLASNTFQESLKNYRDLVLLRNNLDSWSKNIEAYNTMLNTRSTAYSERLPVIRKNTERIKNGNLKKQRDLYAGEYKRIILTDDLTALANTVEKQYLYKLDKVGKLLGELTPRHNMKAAEDKYRLLRGVIKWNIANEYGPRTWQLKKDLKQLDAALEIYESYSKGILSVEKNAPLRFEGYGSRIANLRKHIDALLKQANTTLTKQEKLIESLAVYELRRQQDRIDSYLTHAQFSVAQIQDKASHPDKEEQP